MKASAPRWPDVQWSNQLRQRGLSVNLNATGCREIGYIQRHGAGNGWRLASAGRVSERSDAGPSGWKGLVFGALAQGPGLRAREGGLKVGERRWNGREVSSLEKALGGRMFIPRKNCHGCLKNCGKPQMVRLPAL